MLQINPTLKLPVTPPHTATQPGVVVDDKLNLYSHIEAKVKKTNQMLGIIKSMLKYMDYDNSLYSTKP